MFGSLAMKVLGGGVAAIALIGGIFYMGNSYGAGKKQIEWDKETIVHLENDLAEQKRITESLIQFNEDVEKVSGDTQRSVSEKTNTITEVRYVNNDVVREVFRDSPFLPTGIIYTHDRLALGETIDPILASNATPSNKTAAELLSIVGENYANHRISVEKNEGWNTFYNGIRAANERVQSEGENSSSSPETTGGTPNISRENTAAEDN